jgi:DNA-binding CsgD family transcriptional regulator
MVPRPHVPHAIGTLPVIADVKSGNLTSAERSRSSHLRRGGSHQHLSRTTHGAARRSVLVVKVDVVDEAGAPARRCDVRLVRSVRDPSAEQAWGSDGGEVTAVVILRDVTPSRVVSTVRAATSGGGSISRELLGQLLAINDAARPDPSEPQLTEREYDVLQMLADGETTRGIAERLSYSERTVKNIVRDLLVKLNCKTRAHAVALAVRHGVI